MTGRLRLVLVLVLVLLPLGCARLPSSGPVRPAPDQGHETDTGVLEFTPAGPKPGATRVQIVADFLTAMTASPPTTSIAREYLTDESSRSWVPEKSTVVYDTRELDVDRPGVRLRLDGVTRLDGRGTWLGDPTHGAGLRWRLKLVRESGQWRISDPPDALMLPRSDFEDRFAQYFLYYFDQTGQVLVPEPVYVPRGAQAPTQLVSGLLQGPEPGLDDVERTYLPARTRLDDLSVPIGPGGTAEVSLSDQVLTLDPTTLELALAQLGWTLQQVPGVERMRVTVGGSPLDLPGGRPDLSFDAFSDYDPAASWASGALYGLRAGRVVSWDDGSEHPVSGPLGARALGVRTIAVDLPGDNIAAVTQDGRSVLVGPRYSSADGATGPQDVTTVYQGSDVLRPSYDVYGQLWLADRTADGAELVVVRKGKARALTASGVTGEDVRALAVSRDGTRLLTVIRTADGDELRISRVRHDRDGAVLGLTPARRVGLGPTALRVRALGWRAPGTIALLVPITSDTWQVTMVRLDGSSVSGPASTEPGLFRGRALGMATSPVSGAPLYVATDAGPLFTLAATGRWVSSDVDPGLRAPTYPG